SPSGDCAQRRVNEWGRGVRPKPPSAARFLARARPWRGYASTPTPARAEMERRRTEAQLRALRLMLISLLQRSGAAVTPVVAATLHVSISAEDTTQLVNLASAAVEIVSGAVALYGRIAATKKIG